MPVETPEQATIALEGCACHVDGQSNRVVEVLKSAVISAGLGQFEKPAFRVLDLVLRRHVERRNRKRY